MRHKVETGELFDFTDIDAKLIEAQYDRALGYLRLGELELATKAAQAALKINQDYPPALSLLDLIKQEYWANGLTSIKENKINAGILAFQCAVNIDPTFTDAHYQLANLQLKQDKLEAAEKAAKKILRLNSRSESAHELLGQIKRAYCIRGRADVKRNKLTNAKAAVYEALRLDSNYEPAHELLKKIKCAYYDQGVTLLRENQYNKAMASFEIALAMDSCFTEAHHGIVRTYLDQGALASAEEAIRERLDLSSAPASELLDEIKHSYYNSGILYLGQGKFANAKKAIKEVLRLDSSGEMLLKIKNLYCDQGWTYLSQDKIDFAKKTVKELLLLDSSYEPARDLLETIRDVYCERGRICLKQVDLEAGEKETKDALRLDPSYENAYELLIEIKHTYKARGTIFLNKNQHEKANSDFQKANAIHGTFTETDLIKAYCQLGDFYLRQGELDRIHLAIAEILRFDSSYGPAQKLLDRLKQVYCDHAHVYLSQGKLKEAEKAISDALCLDPYSWSARNLFKNLKQVYYNRVLDSLNEDQYDAALTSFESLLTMDPNFAEAKWTNVLTYLAQGDLTAAGKMVREILEIDLNDYCFDSDDDFVSALLKRIKYIYYDLGVTLLEENQYNEAITNFENAIDIDKDFTEAYIGLQSAYLGFEGCYLRELEVEEETEKNNIMKRISERVELLALSTKSMEESVYLEDDIGLLRNYKGNYPEEIRRWLLTAARYPLLDRQEEIELAKQLEAGEMEHGYTADAERARDQLVQANLRLVISVAKKYQGRNVPLEDLIQEGNIGLIKAARKFDYRRGYKFSSYASWWIRHAIIHALDNSSRSIRIPSYLIAKMKKFDDAYAALRQELRREPGWEEIAMAVDLTVRQVEEILMSKTDTISMDLAVGGECSPEKLGDLIGDLMEDPTTSEQEGPIAEMITKDLILHLFQELPEREQKILEMRFGLIDGEEKTLREVGDTLDVTRERIRQLEIYTIKQLRILYNEMVNFERNRHE